MAKKSHFTWVRYESVLALSSLFALVASFWQSVERIFMLKNPDSPLSCNINPIVDCGGVMDHKLAALFGFPNAFIGIVMFSMLFFASLLLLMGVKFNKKASLALLVLSTFALLFSVWFFGVSLYVIGKVCLFCIVIWPTSIVMFWSTLLHYLRLYRTEQHDKFYATASKYHLEILISIFIAMIILYLFRFRDFYF